MPAKKIRPIRVKTSAPHVVYRIGDLVLHDTRRVHVNMDMIKDAALEAFGLPGSLGQQLQKGRVRGVRLQQDLLSHYVIASIDPNFCVSSMKEETSLTTRTCLNNFLKWEKNAYKACEKKLKTLSKKIDKQFPKK